MEMEITFPGNKRVDAQYRHFTIPTDQPRGQGGDDSAPAPFDLFIASIGTCAGIYALGFMQQRNIPTEGSSIHLRADRDPDTKLIGTITLDIVLPQSFPEKYTEAIIKAVDLCAVKRHLHQPPEFRIQTHIGGPGAV
jgi:putative redox protein